MMSILCESCLLSEMRRVSAYCCAAHNSLRSNHSVQRLIGETKILCVLFFSFGHFTLSPSLPSQSPHASLTLSLILIRSSHSVSFFSLSHFSSFVSSVCYTIRSPKSSLRLFFFLVYTPKRLY